jgi:hypothetical protein
MKPLVHAQLIAVDAVLMEPVERNSVKPKPTVSKTVSAHCSLKFVKERATFLFLNNVHLLLLDRTATLPHSPTDPTQSHGNSKAEASEHTLLLPHAQAILAPLKQSLSLRPQLSSLSELVSDLSELKSEMVTQMLWLALPQSLSLANLDQDHLKHTAGSHHRSTGPHSLVMDLINLTPLLLVIWPDVILKQFPSPLL